MSAVLVRFPASRHLPSCASLGCTSLLSLAPCRIPDLPLAQLKYLLKPNFGSPAVAELHVLNETPLHKRKSGMEKKEFALISLDEKLASRPEPSIRQAVIAHLAQSLMSICAQHSLTPSRQ